MSTIELREKLSVLPQAERREMLLILKELEDKDLSISARLAVPETRSFEDALNYTFQNFDNALRKLAQ
jgi:hypothetical protein